MTSDCFIRNESLDVCLACYNGELFIKEQIQSILPQLSYSDRLIISDDASSDSTPAIISQFAHTKITPLTNSANLGHVKNFENALFESRSDIIFLSDQDDIWTSRKVEEVLNVFSLYPDVVLVQHNLSTISSSGELLRERFLRLDAGIQSRPSFLILELIKPRLYGCAMAFRRSLLNIMLPFPSCVYAHDHWVSVVAPFAGKVYFLDKSLTLYRQHNHNLTPKFSRSVTSIMSGKLSLLLMVLHALFRTLRIRYHANL
jgi:glycosyltransferase involved in cell wall biosynthesis